MRTIIRAVAAVAAPLILAACGSAQGSSDATPGAPVTIDVTVSNATEPYVIPWLVAKQQGFFKAGGVNVDKIVPSKGGSTTARNMLSGDLPIADVGFGAALRSQQAGAPVKVVGGATQSVYVLDFYTLASNTAVQKIGDIKTWAYTNPDSVTEALTHILPEKAGLPGEVKRVSSGGIGEGIALLESGDVDAAVVVPSIVAKNPGKFRLVVSSADYLKAFQQTVIMVTPEYAQTHPKVVKAVVAGYQQAVDWIKQNPDEAGKIYAQYSDIDPAVAKDVVKKAIGFNNWGTGFNSDALNEALEAEKITGDVNLCDLFDDRFLPDGQSSQLPFDCK